MDVSVSSKKAWTITLVGALFFFYSFIQVNMMAPLHGPLMKFFGASPKDIGMLSAWFFWANIIFIFPAGLILDRFPIRFLMIINMLLAVLGTTVFAFADTLAQAAVGRFLSGIMMSFGLIICLKLASIWLPPQRMALASSLIIAIGTFGGIASQAPLAFSIEAFGWRGALSIVALLGIAIGAILWFVIKEPTLREKEMVQGQKINIFKSLWLVFKQKQNWICGFFIALLNLPFAILAALFGATYLMQAYQISLVEASSTISMLFFGMLFGSPFWGWLSDFLKQRKKPMYIGGILCLILMLIVLYGSDFSLLMLHGLFFAVGFTSSSQVLGYPVITESNPSAVSGTALSLAAFLIMGGGYGLGLPFVGELLNQKWEGKIIDGIQNYSIEAYRSAFLVIPIGIILSIIFVYFMKETKCQSIVKKD
ncbi:MAG: MFS transporter [Chlamydiae bacterium]|nr:MFS transporter [Chlamydiota bacterium]